MVVTPLGPVSVHRGACVRPRETRPIPAVARGEDRPSPATAPVFPRVIQKLSTTIRNRLPHHVFRPHKAI